MSQNDDDKKLESEITAIIQGKSASITQIDRLSKVLSDSNRSASENRYIERCLELREVASFSLYDPKKPISVLSWERDAMKKALAWLATIDTESPEAAQAKKLIRMLVTDEHRRLDRQLEIAKETLAPAQNPTHRK